MGDVWLGRLVAGAAGDLDALGRAMQRERLTQLAGDRRTQPHRAGDARHRGAQPVGDDRAHRRRRADARPGPGPGPGGASTRPRRPDGRRWPRCATPSRCCGPVRRIAIRSLQAGTQPGRPGRVAGDRAQHRPAGHLPDQRFDRGAGRPACSWPCSGWCKKASPTPSSTPRAPPGCRSRSGAARRICAWSSTTTEEPAPPAAAFGHGLIGMRERVALHNGRLFAGPTDPGWRVSAWLPAAEADEYHGTEHDDPGRAGRRRAAAPGRASA